MNISAILTNWFGNTYVQFVLNNDFSYRYAALIALACWYAVYLKTQMCVNADIVYGY